MKAIAWWIAEVVEGLCTIEHLELVERAVMDIVRDSLAP
jgi:hypothetical protein